MEEPIPEQWRLGVASVLRSGDRNRIVTRLQSDLDWQALFPDAWDFERFDAMAEALEVQGVTGRLIETMAERGTTYAFWFSFRRVKLYAKINLDVDGRVVIVYSSHTPRKGEESL